MTFSTQTLTQSSLKQHGQVCHSSRPLSGTDFCPICCYVNKHHDQSQLREKGFVSSYNLKSSRKEVRSGAWRQNWRRSLFSLLCSTTQHYWVPSDVTHNVLGPPTSTLIKKVHQRLAHRPVCWSFFPTEGPSQVIRACDKLTKPTNIQCHLEEPGQLPSGCLCKKKSPFPTSH